MANSCRRQQQNLRESSSARRCIAVKEGSFPDGQVSTYNLAKQTVMTDKSLRNFSVFVFLWNILWDQMESTNYEAINIKCAERVCILALVTLHANRIFPAPYYTLNYGLSGSTVFFHMISQTGWFSGKSLLNMKCVFFIFPTTFVRNISNSNKNSARHYHTGA
jgi:hypothetical protein